MYYFYMIQSIKKKTEIYPSPFSAEKGERIYTGSTKDLRKRLHEHNQGEVTSTRRYVPWRLVYYESYLSDKDARMREQKFKKHGKGNAELKKRLMHSLGENYNKSLHLSTVHRKVRDKKVRG